MAERPGIGSVRVRITVSVVVIVAIALFVAAATLVHSLRSDLTRSAIRSAELYASQVAGQVERGTPAMSIVYLKSDDTFLQIVGADGTVLVASQLPLVTAVQPGNAGTVAVPFDDERFAVATVQTRDGTTVVAGRSLDSVAEATGLVTGWLAIVLPLLLFLFGGLTWRVVGGVLAPVEAIRREVEAISAAELHRRVPDPPGSDEIARLAATMNRMLDRLERAQTRQRRLVSDASHELRSPIAALRQHAEVTLAHPERVAAVDLAGTVHLESLRLQRLVDDLLTLARADEHTLTLRRQPVDVDDLVLEAGRRLRETTTARVDTTAVSAGQVAGDPSALRRIVDNLADNAGRFASGRVAFAVVEHSGSVRLDVDDDGPGIPVEERERVFDRFVRLDGARARDDGGAGLGLAIVAELVLAHGGTVVVVDSPLGGARLRVCLPAAVQPGFSGRPPSLSP